MGLKVLSHHSRTRCVLLWSWMVKDSHFAPVSDTVAEGHTALPISFSARTLTRAGEQGHVLDFIFGQHHAAAMSWRVAFHDEFAPEFRDLPTKVQDEVYTVGRLLEQFGPQLGRPQVDTLNGSRHANMKEMRFGAADGEWRVAFAFDPVREAVLLVAGDKSGGSGRRFYRALIRKADERFDRHLARLADERGTQ